MPDRVTNLFSHDRTSYVAASVLTILVTSGVSLRSTEKVADSIWDSTRLIMVVKDFRIMQDQNLFASFLACSWPLQNPLRLCYFLRSGSPDPSSPEEIASALSGLESFMTFVFGDAYLNCCALLIRRVKNDDPFYELNQTYICGEIERTLSATFTQLTLKSVVSPEGIALDLRTTEAVVAFFVASLARMQPDWAREKSFFSHKKAFSQLVTPVAGGSSAGVTRSKQRTVVAKQSPQPVHPVRKSTKTPGGVIRFCRSNVSFNLLPSPTARDCSYGACRLEHYVPGKHTGNDLRAWWAVHSTSIKPKDAAFDAYIASLADAIAKHA
jgi:hypothetical protein